MVSELEVRNLGGTGSEKLRMSVRRTRGISPDVVDITPNVECTDTTIDLRGDEIQLLSYSGQEEIAEKGTDVCAIDCSQLPMPSGSQESEHSRSRGAEGTAAEPGGEGTADRTVSADPSPQEQHQETVSSQRHAETEGENRPDSHAQTPEGDPESAALNLKLRVAVEERRILELTLELENRKREERKQQAEARKQKQLEKEEKEKAEKAEAEQKVAVTTAAAVKLATEAQPLGKGASIEKLRQAVKQNLVSKNLSPLPEPEKRNRGKEEVSEVTDLT